ILGTGKGIFRVFSSDFPLLGAPPIPVLCSIILTLDFPLLGAKVALTSSLKAHLRRSAQVGFWGIFLSKTHKTDDPMPYRLKKQCIATYGVHNLSKKKCPQMEIWVSRKVQPLNKNFFQQGLLIL
ncbi:hypothetical protein L208DRAFT_1278771, partial [Tricholoma matsutake]